MPKSREIMYLCSGEEEKADHTAEGGRYLFLRLISGSYNDCLRYTISASYGGRFPKYRPVNMNASMIEIFACS